jgi:hypothetical protein
VTVWMRSTREAVAEGLFLMALEGPVTTGSGGHIDRAGKRVAADLTSPVAP